MTQLTLFGPVAVHIARRGNCAVCRASLAIAADRDLDGCHDCPGLVVPVPWWMVLPDAAGLDEAAAELEEAA